MKVYATWYDVWRDRQNITYTNLVEILKAAGHELTLDWDDDSIMDLSDTDRAVKRLGAIRDADLTIVVPDLRNNYDAGIAVQAGRHVLHLVADSGITHTTPPWIVKLPHVHHIDVIIDENNPRDRQVKRLLAKLTEIATAVTQTAPAA